MALLWLRVSSGCQKRAAATKEAVAATKDVGLSLFKKKACPITGQAGICEPCNFLLTVPDPGGLARKCFCDGNEPTKVDKVLHRGCELFLRSEFTYAELSFDKAIETDPYDWRGYYGKVRVLQAEAKHFKAFQACQRGCEKLPEDGRLKELREAARAAYKQSKAAPPAPKAAAPDCPISSAAGDVPAAPVSRIFTGRVATKEERQERKQMILGVFREQWARIGKTKETMGYNEYSQAQAQGLQIKGGHQPMPRPKDITVPEDYRQDIGTVTAEHLGKHYNCESTSDRLLISLYGDIFDVSDRPDKYGRDAPYYYFAGRDITWGLVSGNDSEDNVNMFYDLFKMEEEELSKKLQCICSWLGFYEVEYGKPVGRLVEFEAESDLPAPPIHKEECVVQ